MKKILLATLVGLLLLSCSARQKLAGQPGLQISDSFSKEITQTVGGDYLLYLPEGYNASQAEWPLVLFLHGAGERGSDLEKVKFHGLPKHIAAGEQFPFIAVSPQCPEGQWWDLKMLSGLLDHIEANYRVDKDRIYLTGLSMGGFGTEPCRFAAIAPVCGGGQASSACSIKNLPVWVFHGARDNIVPLSASEEMVKALERCGGDVRFTVYPEAGHDSWTETYQNPELYKWLLDQRR